MSYTDYYANFDLVTGANDGTSEADAWQTWDDVIAGLTGGIRVNIKKQSSPYDISPASIDYDLGGITNPPSPTTPIMFRGYESVTGDDGMWEATCDQGALRYFRFRNILPGAFHFENLKVHAAPTNNGLVISLSASTDQTMHIRNCSLIGSAIDYTGSALNCYFGLASTLTVGRVVIGSVSNRASHNLDCVYELIGSGNNNFSHDHMFSCDNFNTPSSFTNCIFISRNITTQDGMNYYRPETGESITFDQCRFYGFDNALVLAAEPATDDRAVTITNCVFEDCARGVYRGGATDLGMVKIRDCYYRNMTTEFTNYTYLSEYNNTPLTADAFTDPANGNLLVNSVAGGGQVIRDAGGSYDNGGTFETTSEFFGTMFEEGGGSVTPSTHTYFG